MPYASNGIYSPVSGAETAAPGNVLQSATWNNINSDYQTAFTAIGTGVVTNAMVPVPGQAAHYLLTQKAISFAATAGSDLTSFAITLPTGVSAYSIAALRIGNATGTLGTSGITLYTAASAGGVQVLSSTATTVTTAAVNTNNNYQSITPSQTIAVNAGAIFLHVAVSGGSNAADVSLQIVPVY